MEKLRNHFLKIYLKELTDLETGHPFNQDRLCYMKKLLGVIFYLEDSDLSPSEAIDIIETIIQ